MKTVYKHAESFKYGEYEEAWSRASALLSAQIEEHPAWAKFPSKVRIFSFGDKMFLNMQIMDPHQIDWSRWWMRVIAISVLAWPLRILVEWLSHHFN